MRTSSQKIKRYLDHSRIRYWTGDSWSTESSGDEAVVREGAVDEVVRCLLVRVDGKPAIVAVGSDEDLNIEEMRRQLQNRHVELLEENEYQRLFPGCDTTAIPALGVVRGLQVYCSRRVVQGKHVCFNSGTHDEIIQMATSDFIKLAKPIVGNFAQSAAFSARAAYYW